MRITRTPVLGVLAPLAVVTVVRSAQQQQRPNIASPGGQGELNGATAEIVRVPISPAPT